MKTREEMEIIAMMLVIVILSTAIVLYQPAPICECRSNSATIGINITNISVITDLETGEEIWRTD